MDRTSDVVGDPGRGAPSLPPGLYVVGTPIGNLGDLGARAAGVLAAAAVIAAEDTRTTARLFGSRREAPRMVALTEHNVSARAPGLVEAARTSVVAVVSEAGTPGIADPGARLVAAAHAAEVPVFAVPGPSALAAAISVSGFDGDVHFLGFLPRAGGERRRRLREAAGVAAVLVFFESPARLPSTLADLAAELRDPETVVCRELTKLHEEVRRGRASVLATHYSDRVRGECTVVVRSPGAGGNLAAARELTAAMRRAGARRAPAAAEVARATGVTRAIAYDLWDGP